MFGRDDDEELLEGTLGAFGGDDDEYEHRKTALDRAKEIHSGLASGAFERDELVWDFVQKLEERNPK